MKEITAENVVAMMAGLLLLAASAMVDVANFADVPEKIQIYDAQGERLSLSVDKTAKEAHGDLRLRTAAAARVIQVTISELFG